MNNYNEYKNIYETSAAGDVDYEKDLLKKWLADAKPDPDFTADNGPIFTILCCLIQ